MFYFNIVKLKRTRLSSLLSLMSVTSIFILFCTDHYLNTIMETIEFKPRPKVKFRTEKVIRIVTTVCAGSGKLNKLNIKHNAIVEALTLIKSLFISSLVHNVSSKLEFHVLTDSDYLNDILSAETVIYSIKLKDNVKFDMHFYSVNKSMPQTHASDFVYGSVNCSYVRLFYPDVLPLHINTVLHLDTDMIVTGNIEKIWNKFHGEPNQYVAGLTRNWEPGVTQYKIFPRLIGLNAGVMFMNLEAMRNFGWTRIANEIYESHKDDKINEAEIVNYILYFHTDRLKILPCHYNFIHLHCDREWTCLNNSMGDENSIQIIRGTRSTFHEKNRSYHPIFHMYSKFDLKEHEQVKVKLLKHAKNGYILTRKQLKCKGDLRRFLFPDL